MYQLKTEKIRSVSSGMVAEAGISHLEVENIRSQEDNADDTHITSIAEKLKEKVKTNERDLE